MSDVHAQPFPGPGAGPGPQRSSSAPAANWNRSLLEPTAPHDDLSFAELSRVYNYQTVSDRAKLFTRLIIKECHARIHPANQVRVLDVGCGKGIELCVDYQWALREQAAELWGLEPDKNLSIRPGLFHRHQSALMEEADLPADSFDVAYSFMVMEHVLDPDAFLRAVHRCLKPGGVYLFATPNKRHYFTRIASALHALKLDEMVLRAINRQSVDEYHYPVQYRFNDEKRINAAARELGFLAPEFVYLEEEGPFGYFPRPLRFIYHALAAKRRIIRQPKSLLTMMCRLTKPNAS